MLNSDIIRPIVMGLLILGLVACSSDPEMREAFGDGSPRILIDEATGGAYVVQHNIGDNYTVMPLKK